MTDQNLYQSPDSNVSPDSSVGSGGRVYKPDHVGIATFLGSPLAGFWLLGSNYVVLGEPQKRLTMVACGVAATLALIVLSLNLPDEAPNFLINIVIAVAMMSLCKALQKDALDGYVDDDSKWYSGWRAAGIGVLFILVVMLLVFVVVVGALLFGYDFLGE